LKGRGEALKSKALIVFLTSFLIDLGLSSVNFGVPLYSYKLGASQYLIGVIASAFGLSYVFSATYSTRIVFGRTVGKMIILLLSLYAFIVFLYVFIRQPALFVALRCAEGFALGNLYPLTDTLPAPSKDGKGLVPWYNAGWALSYIVAPVILGYIIPLFGFSSPFIFATTSSVAALIVVRASYKKLGLGATLSRPQLTVERRQSILGEVALPAFISGFVTAVFSSLYPAYLESQGYSYELIGAITGVMATFRTVILASAGRVEMAIGQARLKSLGYALSAFIAIPTIFSGAAEQLICAVCVGVGVGLLYHAGLSSSLKQPKEHWTSMLEASLGSGFFSGPLVGAALSGFGVSYVYAGVAVVPIASLIQNVRRTNKQRTIEHRPEPLP